MAHRTGTLPQGVYPMLVTPFDEESNIVWADLDRLISYELEHRVHGLAALGLGGEASRLSEHERLAVADRVLGHVGGRIPVIIGASAEDTHVACRLAHHAAAHGAAAVMVAPPSVAAIGRDDLVRHYLAVAAAAEPACVMIQDAPAYLGVALDGPFILEVARERPNVRYAKIEAAPAGERVAELVALVGDRIEVFGGQAGLHLLDILDAGGVGIIPGCECSGALVVIFEAHRSGRREEAEELYRQIVPLIAFEIQTLDFFIACSKELLRRQGVLSSAALRAHCPLGPASYRALERHARAITGSTVLSSDR